MDLGEFLRVLEGRGIEGLREMWLQVIEICELQHFIDPWVATCLPDLSTNKQRRGMQWMNELIINRSARVPI